MTDNAARTSAKYGKAPLISVVLPVYNGQKYLAEAIDSILTQTFTDFELIMIDDGSTDHSLEILRQYEQHDLRVQVVARANRGIAATLNESIDIARGTLIARMDEDDVCNPNRLSSQYEFMQCHSDAVAVGSAANFIDAEGSKICTYFPSPEDASLRCVFPGSPFIHPSVMFRKAAFYQAGKYPANMKWGGEDVILFGRIAKFGLLHNLSEPLINYRLVPGSMSRKPPEFRNMLISIISDEIAGKPVTDKQLQLLQKEARKIDKSQALFDYNFEVAKLYIWSGGDRDKTNKHLKKCFAWPRPPIKVFFMYFLLLIPKRWTNVIYFRLKGRRYASF